MGRTHPQLARSSDSHRILEGKACQRLLVLMDCTLPRTLIQRTWSVVWGPPNFNHNPLRPIFLDSPRLRRLRSVGRMALLLWDGRQNWAKLTESQDAEAGGVDTVCLGHVTWEDSQPLLTPGMEVWPELHHGARLMTQSSIFVSLNTVNLRGFRQILLPYEVETVLQCIPCRMLFPSSW